MRRAYLLIAALLALSALSIATPAEAQRYIHPWKVFATTAELTASTCDRGQRDRFAFTLEDEVFYFCDGSSWGAIANVVDTAGGSPFAVDNLSLQTNTIGSTNTNGDIIFDPDGTGKVVIAGSSLIDFSGFAHTGSVDFTGQTGDTLSFVYDVVNVGGNGSAVSLGGNSASGTTANGTLEVTGNITADKKVVHTPQAFTVADSGDGSPAAGTLTPTGDVILGTCNDADGCAVTMSETGAASGHIILFINLSANNFTFADSAGVQELSGSLTLGLDDNFQMVYATNHWAQATAVVDN